MASCKMAGTTMQTKPTRISTRDPKGLIYKQRRVRGRLKAPMKEELDPALPLGSVCADKQTPDPSACPKSGANKGGVGPAHRDAESFSQSSAVIGLPKACLQLKITLIRREFPAI